MCWRGFQYTAFTSDASTAPISRPAAAAPVVSIIFVRLAVARLLLPALRLRTSDLVNCLSRLPVRMFVFSPASACDARASAFLAAGPSQRTNVSLVCT